MSHVADRSQHEQNASIRVISYNCWGLKYLSAHRHARLVQIGQQIASASPAPQIVGLQECWTQEDYLSIRKLTQHILPHGKFYHSGFFGGGLAILSAWPIEESSMFAYPLNGRPAAFYRGDWYVGKGVACARVRMNEEIVEVFCTHLHAPYEAELHDSYACHRTAQAWEIAKKMRHAAERGHIVLGLGDFNMLPTSLAHQLIEAHSPARDIWEILKPGRESQQGSEAPTVETAVTEYGATCDSALNTWRWSKQMQKDLKKGREQDVDMKAQDQKAQRLDYIFFADVSNAWQVYSVNVGMTARHPELKVSLSDHFSVEATFTKTATNGISQPMVTSLTSSTYDTILDMIRSYMLRERKQRTLRMMHFQGQLVISLACLIAVWWSPHNYVAFILMLVSSVGLTAGVLDGLMGGLFVKSELRALKEFRWEIENARQQSLATIATGKSR